MAMNTANYDNSATGYVPLADVIKEVLSKEIIRTALPETVFLQAAVVKEDLNTTAGLQIDMIKFGALEHGGILSEHIPIPTNNLESSTVSIAVGERGNAVAASNLLIQAGRVDILMEAAAALGEDAGLVMDTEIRDAFYLSSNEVYADNATSEAYVGLRDVLTYELIDSIIEQAATLRARPFIAPNGERYYVMFIHPRHFTQLKRQIGADMERFNRLTYVKDYPAGRPVWRGEIAQVDNIKLISTTLVKQGVDSTDTWSYDATLATGGASSAKLLTCIFTGYNGVGFAVRQALSFRENGVEDFGRIRKLAWYGIWGSGLVNEESTMIIYTGSNITEST